MLALVSALLLQTAAPGEARPLNGDEVVWEVINTPTSRDFYPPAPKRRGIRGRVLLNCLIDIPGTLSDCRIVSETPEKLGFGPAAVEMRMLFKARSDRQGQSVAGRRVLLPIKFDLR